MWRLIDRLLGLVLMTTGASALFVVAATVSSSWRATEGPGDPIPAVDPSAALAPDAALAELRLEGRGDVLEVFAGQPIAIDIVLRNVDPERAPIPLDSETFPWERRLVMAMTTDQGDGALDGFNWHARLLDVPARPSGRTLTTTPARTTLVLDGVDLATLAPGRHFLTASLPPGIVATDALRIVPLTLHVGGPPANDDERATVNLSIAEVAALRGDTIRVIDAAETALALDGTRTRAITLIAEAYEVEGDLSAAIEWHERYLATLDAEDDAADVARLEAYVEALRRQ